MERKDNCFMRGMVSQRTVNPSPKGIVGSNPTEAANIALVAQLAERLICNQDVGSSILLGGTIFGGLAHLVEQLLCKQQAIGSNPITSTILCSVNSDGRVSALHAECRRFDPVTEYQFVVFV
jgi:hypothetical protein